MILQGHEWPNDTPEYPKASQLAVYLRKYALRFELNKYIQVRARTIVLTMSTVNSDKTSSGALVYSSLIDS